MRGLAGVVVKAAHWVERARARSTGLLEPSAAQAAARSLSLLATAVRAADQPDAADDLMSFAARFLLENTAVNGVDLIVDGGWHCR